MGFMVQAFHEHYEGQGPGGAYMEAKDGHVAFHVPDMTQEQFSGFATALGHADALQDPRLATVEARRANLRLVQQTAAQWLREFTPKELFNLLTPLKIPVGPVYSIGDVLEDRHIKAREAFVPVPHETVADLTLLAPWIRFSGTPTQITHAGAAVGEYNAEVYRDVLGLDEQAIESLRRDGAI